MNSLHVWRTVTSLPMEQSCSSRLHFRAKRSTSRTRILIYSSQYFPTLWKVVSFPLLPVHSAWRPFAGPNNDWPLALCDYTSIDPDHDIIVADVLHRDRVGENQLLWPNSDHQWYYIKDQQPDDIIVFRNVDTMSRRAGKSREDDWNMVAFGLSLLWFVVGFHCAFLNPHSHSPPRTSCEVRFVAFRWVM